MRRLVLLLLVLVLPLQAAWAVAAGYCQHEATVAGGWHFGHHEHRHYAVNGHMAASQTAGASDAETTAGAEDRHGNVNKPLLDNDCGICHLASAQVAPATHPLLQQPHRVEAAPRLLAARYASASPPAPDRPQWRGLR